MKSPTPTLAPWIVACLAVACATDQGDSGVQHLNRAVGLWLDGNESAARIELESIGELGDESVVVSALAEHLDGEHADTHWGRILGAHANERWNEVLQLARDANSESVLDEVLYAHALVRNGEFDSALRWLEPLAVSLPETAWVARQLGDAHYAKGDLARARLEYNRSVQLLPGSLHVWDRLSEVHARQGTWSSALDAIDNALHLAPDNAALGERRMRYEAEVARLGN